MTRLKKAHIVSHTHWDREWYLPYEKHHVRLVELVDVLLDKLDSDTAYRSFYLDGQTIILEDYLKVRPERRDKLEHYIRTGRILIGPWYILQDAFLTSSEANVRNMQIGRQDALRYGEPAPIGYFPDTFGLAGQTPQLMMQSGITNAFFGRGVKPTGFNNTVSDGGYESSFSELIWEGPDGSRILGILFANWYSNGNEIPADETAAREFWDRKLADAEKYASTGELLFMNGCDHQPIQLDLPEAIRQAQTLYPNVEFIHSNFPDYLAALEADLRERETSGKPGLSTVSGELRSQRTDGWGTLVNTASARVYLKQMNQRGQAMLEKVAEPLAALASLAGRSYPHHLFTYAWKTLMQNHPHDSICGCSVDEVHREMVTRFDKSRHVAESIAEDSARFLAEAVDTLAFAPFGTEAIPFVVTNTTGWSRTGAVSIELEVARLYLREGFSLEETARRMQETSLDGRLLVDEHGNSMACSAQDLGLQFGYDLPDNQFRQSYMCRKVKLAFEASNIPALGLRTYAWVQASGAAPDPGSLLRGDRVLENDSLRIEISDDGSFDLLDKRNGISYNGLGVYEDTGDIGNEYMYRQPDGEVARTTMGETASISVFENTPFRAVIEIKHEWEIPASADERLDAEQRALVYYPERKAQRSKNTVLLKLRTLLTLEREGPGLSIESTLDNQAKDHRIRMLFPTGIKSGSHHVDSMFEIAERDNIPPPEWLNPSYTQHQQAFVDISNDVSGLTVANLGLNEYEVLRDGRNTIAVTLLRSVGELGDWGWFPTPEAQCLGEHSVQLKLIPHNGDGVLSGAYAEAYQFQVPWTVQQTGIHEGTLSSGRSPFMWECPQAAFSSMKINEKTGDLMLRWYNMRPLPGELQLNLKLPHASIYKTTILEEPMPGLDNTGEGRYSLLLGSCEIATYGVSLGE
ncbi:alpha-mannosidase [Paenibacillus donghaensis]|uniref:Alpha-mannosidase n=1 Tax=Paenibacillus donghaensis TaxID=414771 RepID=A0A2Z2KSI2_9BACL|nr:alpha-mannosidase [Paenibacillus donghaensis]ASA25879.1 alpha-mannosidase [Paenibacillus donghaensis]